MPANASVSEKPLHSALAADAALGIAIRLGAGQLRVCTRAAGLLAGQPFLILSQRFVCSGPFEVIGLARGRTLVAALAQFPRRAGPHVFRLFGHERFPSKTAG